MNDMKPIMEKIKPILSNKYPQAIMLCGLPASGKSTLASLLSAKGFYVICKDDIRYQLAKIDYGEAPEAILEPVLQSYNTYLSITQQCLTEAWFLKTKSTDKTKAIKSILERAYNHYKSLPYAEPIPTQPHLTFFNKVKQFFCSEPAQIKPYRIIQPAKEQQIDYQTLTTYLTNAINNLYASNTSSGIIYDATHITNKQRQVVNELIHNRLPLSIITFDIDSRISFERAKQREEITITTYNNKPVGGRAIPLDVISHMEQIMHLPIQSNSFIIYQSINKDHKYKEWFYGLQTEKFVGDVLRRYLNNNPNDKTLHTILSDFDATYNYDQKNEHHDLLLHEHLIQAAENIRDRSFQVFASALLHDIGKPPTQTFTAKLKEEYNGYNKDRRFKVESKGETNSLLSPLYRSNDTKSFYVSNDLLDFDSNAHYYCHENVSAIRARHIMLELGFSEQVANQIYMYIKFHMFIPFHQPLDANTIKNLSQYFNYDQIKDLLYIRYGDVMAKGNHTHESLCEEMKILHESLAHLNKYYGLGKIKVFA